MKTIIWDKNKEWILENCDFSEEHIEKLKKYENIILWFKEYKRIFGRHSFSKFVANIQVFLSFVPRCFCFDYEKSNGEYWESKSEAFVCFAEFLNSKTEAYRYFECVDEVTPLT